MNNKDMNNRDIENMPMIVIDFGANEATYYCSDWEDKKPKKIKKEDVLNLPNIYKDKNYLFVVEKSHMDQDRNHKSLSQPFLQHELRKFYDDIAQNGHVLKFFPEMKTPRALHFSGIQKSNAQDPYAIYNYIIHHKNEIHTYKNPRKFFGVDNKRFESWQIKKNMNYTLNLARRFNYGQPKVADRNRFDNDQIADLIKNNLNYIAENLSEDSKDVFGFIESNKWKKNMPKHGGVVGQYRLNRISMNAIYAIMSAFFEVNLHEDSITHKWSIKAEYRVRESTGNLVGWKYASRFLFGFTPHHLKGGVARSNLKHHNFKAFVARKGLEKGISYTYLNDEGKVKYWPRGKFSQEQEEYFIHCAKIHKKACKEMFTILKNLLKSNQLV